MSPQGISLASNAAGRPVTWLVLSVLCLAIDYASGPMIQFPIAYLVPISLAAWSSGRVWGIGLAVFLPLCRLYFTTAVWDSPQSLTESGINAAIRVVVFVTFAWLIDRTARQMRALRHMRLLEGMLGVCAVCKQIRDEGTDSWEPLDVYVSGHPGAFRHDVCPACASSQRDVFDRR
jgi:hypothetical protein